MYMPQRGDSIPSPTAPPPTVAAVTGTPEVRAQAVAALAARQRGLRGPDHRDFEGLKGDTIKTELCNLSKELDAALPQGKTMPASSPTITWYTGLTGV